MNFDVSHRDRYGFLTGSYKDGLLSRVAIHDGIKPLLFPCEQCKRIVFHVGKSLGILDPKKYQLLCNECTTINSDLTQPMVEKLERGVGRTDGGAGDLSGRGFRNLTALGHDLQGDFQDERGCCEERGMEEGGKGSSRSFQR